ncbi:hypothetical protein BGZ73_003260 [Actinomortierella ambigua]|nr:hypothetical protein BGZ73_003260 [Actinomortierella ambigua]
MSPSFYYRYYFRRRHRRHSSINTELYQKLLEIQREEQKQKQLRQHRIWQHVQDRIARQQQLLDEEEAEAKKAAEAAAVTAQQEAATSTEPSTASSKSKDTNAAVQALFADLNAELAASASKGKGSSNVPALKDPSTFQKHKRSIRWGLQNNTIRRFDKNIPLQDVKLPPMDRRPTKSALKVRTPNGIQKPAASTAGSKFFPPRKTAADFF